ncbi:RNA polymerase Rpc34 [Hyaloraphidium curvatum]|nr:RNA polymerase Rpc34 [Hyaloraphidium curvatum]
MDVHEKMIYGHIKNAGNKGIWVKDLKQKSNIHSKIVQDAIKSLEKKQFIKSVKSVKNPIKKVYMLFELDPSEEVSGGTWYTDHEFDLEFITKVSEWVEKFIFKYSFPKGDPQLIFPPSYAKYPSLLKIVAAIEEYKVVNTALREEDVQVILDRLVFDGKIEKKLRTSGFGSDDEGDDLFVYKTIRDRFGKTTAWTDFPCGTCPVYDQCDDDGPITPMTCEYLTKWLATENAARDW